MKRIRPVKALVYDSTPRPRLRIVSRRTSPS
jgi:hypothetical protein